MLNCAKFNKLPFAILEREEDAVPQCRQLPKYGR